MLSENDFKTYGEVAGKVFEITETENSFIVKDSNYENKLKEISNIEYYSDYGLQTLGDIIGFPSSFIKELSETDIELAEQVIKSRIKTYFSKDNSIPILIREYNNKVHGVVTDRYSCFDDNDVMNVISETIFEEMSYTNTIITPDRLHLRAVDRHRPFNITGDEDDIYICYFIDNSMVGDASFRIRMGVYRPSTETAVVCNKKEYTLCKNVHRGNKKIKNELEENLKKLELCRTELEMLFIGSAETEPYVDRLNEEQRNIYLSRTFGLSVKEQKKVMARLDFYSSEFQMRSEWAFMNAISDYAKNVSDINYRITLESKSFEHIYDMMKSYILKSREKDANRERKLKEKNDEKEKKKKLKEKEKIKKAKLKEREMKNNKE